MTGRVATVILNRNMPDITDRLVEYLSSRNNGETDIFVVESGSERGNLSRYCTWWADWDQAIKEGLRYPRGFNYALAQLMREGRFHDYDYFFLVCNDIEFLDSPVPALLSVMERHPRVGIVSPCAENWRERDLIGEGATRYVWHTNHLAWMLRRSFVEAVMNPDARDHMGLLYDGTNFRGYYADTELVVKGYVNEFATALTTRTWMRENTELLRRKADLMRTDPFDINQRWVFEEGKEWMRRKYGFTTRLQMQTYATMFYNRFFRLYPNLARYKLVDSHLLGEE